MGLVCCNRCLLFFNFVLCISVSLLFGPNKLAISITIGDVEQKGPAHLKCANTFGASAIRQRGSNEEKKPQYNL